MNIGPILKSYRDNTHLSQEAVAAYLGIHREELSYYETDRRDAPLDVLEKLADLYGAQLNDFFETDQLQLQANVAFAFRADAIASADLITLAEFRKAVKNYFKICELEKKHAS